MYYVTFGSDGYFNGGWVEVDADTYSEAYELFDKAYSTNAYCSIYSEEQFKGTNMYKNGNLGARCHEKISKEA